MTRHSESRTDGMIKFKTNNFIDISENCRFNSCESGLSKWLQRLSHHDIGEI